jgi:hypothetical protein
MRRVARRLFTLLSALSLLLCVTTAVLWGRGYFMQDDFGFSVPMRVTAALKCDVFHRSGNIWFAARLLTWHNVAPTAEDHAARTWWTEGPVGMGPDIRPVLATWLSDERYVYPPGNLSGLTFEIKATNPAQPALRTQSASLFIRHWLLLIVTTLLPTLWLVRRRHRLIRERRAAGRCMHCGYDLRSSPDRCPECGTEVVKETT